VIEPDPKFEQELREGLRLREPSAGFADRVIDRLNHPHLVPKPTFFHLPALRWAIAAILLLTVALGGYREHQRRVAGERARQQVLLALRITSSTLHAVHDKVVSGDSSGGGE
jgi:hypothetical protein